MRQQQIASCFKTIRLTAFDDVTISHIARDANAVDDEDDVVDFGWFANRNRLAELLRSATDHFRTRVALEPKHQPKLTLTKD